MSLDYLANAIRRWLPPELVPDEVYLSSTEQIWTLTTSQSGALTSEQLDDEALLIVYDNANKGTLFSLPMPRAVTIGQKGWVKIVITERGLQRLKQLGALP